MNWIRKILLNVVFCYIILGMIIFAIISRIVAGEMSMGWFIFDGVILYIGLNNLIKAKAHRDNG